NRFVPVLSAAACLAVAACTCGKKTADQTFEKGQVGLPTRELPRDLKPLPEPPPLNIPQEQLPGAGGELAVVVARPQGAAAGEIRPTVTFSKPVRTLESVSEQRAEDKAAPIARIEPSLEGEWKWLGSASAEFV